MITSDKVNDLIYIEKEKERDCLVDSGAACTRKTTTCPGTM